MSARGFTAGSFASTGLSGAWDRLSLARRFAVLALCLSIAGTLVLGTWVSEKIEQTAKAREAGSAAIYIGHFVSPLLQDLGSIQTLSEARIDELDGVIHSAALRLRVTAMKVWDREGRLLYNSGREGVGLAYPVEGSLERALSGLVSAEFEEASAESAAEFRSGHSLLEIYAPIRSQTTGEVIAVAEFYEQANDLAAELSVTQVQSWVFTGAILLCIFAAFSTIIRDGSQTIEIQRRELTRRISELSDVMHKEQALQERVDRGARNVIEENERFLKLVGSELHDGPAQLISLALLKLDSVGAPESSSAVSAIHRSLQDAMRNIRSISAGLLLPGLESDDVVDCLRHTVSDHEKRTQTRVKVRLGAMPTDCPSYIRICLCRFVQEGLANAFRHAQGKDQTVIVFADRKGVRAEVSDRGDGFAAERPVEYGKQLGLIGLRARIESIRGTFAIYSQPGIGTTIEAWLPLDGGLPGEA